MEDIQAAIEAGKQLAAFQIITPKGEGVPVALVPESTSVRVPPFSECEKWLTAPRRKRGAFHFADVESFTRYFNEHKNVDSRIFATLLDSGASFEGELDFHGINPSFREHRCECQLQPTHEFTVWTQNNRKVMNQAEFAAFLEENAEMFFSPTGAALLELVSTLEGTSNVNVTSGVKLQNQTIKFTFNEEVELKGGVTGTQSGNMEIPATISAKFSPFEGTGHYEFPARLRYKIADRKLSFWYQASNMHLVVRSIAMDMLRIIEKQTGVVPFKV